MNWISFILIVGVALLGIAHCQVSAAGKRAILKVHNDYRSKIAKGLYKVKGTRKPPAANMRKLKWDSRLEKSAQAASDTCINDHTPDLVDIGESIYWESSAKKFRTFDRVVKTACIEWFVEFQDYGWKGNKFTEEMYNTGVSHAVQMAWARTSRIGCGATYCDDGKRVVFFCHYQEMGNYKDELIYLSGKACSKCPRGTKCEKKSGLCV